MKKKIIISSLVVIFLAVSGLAYYFFIMPKTDIPPKTQVSREDKSDKPFARQILIEGLEHPWDVAVDNDGEVYFTERSNGIFTLSEGKKELLLKPTDLVATGEGGMLGLTLDSDFSDNRYMYACFNTSKDVRLVRFMFDNGRLTNRKDLVTGIPRNESGRHSGCRPRSDTDGNIWLGTGDAANNTNPQNPNSLGGKVLRVDRSGNGVEGNLLDPFDYRIFSYGHRNVQGIALFDSPRNGNYGYSIEHGSSRDDEVNQLVGGNFGWDPGSGYNESVPMTDLEKFPEAVESVWNSGSPTIAPSGGTMIYGREWGKLAGKLAMAVQKGEHVRILSFDDKDKLIDESTLIDDVGRVRTVYQAPDGSLYITTDNGGDDKIIKLSK